MFLFFRHGVHAAEMNTHYVVPDFFLFFYPDKIKYAFCGLSFGVGREYSEVEVKQTSKSLSPFIRSNYRL